MQKDATFKTVEEKLIYCSKVIKSRYVSRPPISEFDIIALGIDSVRQTRSGELQGYAFVGISEEDKKKQVTNSIKSIMFKGKDTQKINNIQPFCAYKSKLGRFKEGDFIADDRTIFENPIKLDVDPIELLTKTFNIGFTTIANSYLNLAKENKTSTGTFSDRTDWRIIKAMIGRYGKGKRDDGTEWGNYTVTDDSLEEGDFISPDNEYWVKQGFSVWVNPLWITLEEGNEAYFIGPINASKGSASNPKKPPYQVSMTAYLVIPTRQTFGAIKQ